MAETITYLPKSKKVLRKGMNSAAFSANQSVPVLGKLETSTAGDEKIINWFTPKNDEPKQLLTLLGNNNMAMPILATKTKFIVGKGVITYKEEIIEGKKQIILTPISEIDDFLEANDFHSVLSNMCSDYQILGNGYCEGRFNRENKIVSVAHKDASYIRMGELNKNGYPDKYFLAADWANVKAENITSLQAAIRFTGELNTPEEFLAWKQAHYPSCLFHVKNYTPGYPTYGIPEWNGTRAWLELANLIPLWHISGIKNGYTIRYMVEVSEDCFSSIMGDEAEIEKVRQDLLQKIDDKLAGAENTGKTLFLFMNDSNFRDKGLIRITPIPTDLKDDAFSILFEQSKSATTSGFTLPPPLAAIEKDGGISSGSEMEHAYNIWLHLHANAPRQILLNPLRMIAKINGWDKTYGVKFGIENVQLTTMDINPTGTQNTMV